jgi:hypothetical protein
MARVRTVEFLPEIFQTSTNQQFLSATLDQLVQEPSFKKIQGFVGRRTGPGVNANDNYVAETDTARADYQLEPGVVLLNEDRTKIREAITYPGIDSALNLQGADTVKDSRLYTSDYYTWDPFIDFDKFVNFSQYYWLPGGPDDVNVFAETVPTQDNFVVTRENGVYTFSGQNGNNPVLTLVRGGNYTFQVAQNDKETINYRVTNDGTASYVIDFQPNPTLTLIRGNTYVFNLVLRGAFPFYIKTAPTLGTTNLYNSGVTNNGAFEGLVTFTVPENAPDVLYYANSTQSNMRGTLNIVDATPGTGPGFWIQAAPGVSGKLPQTPNISSRDVLGVINNGEDLGTVQFNVPLSTAQSFYYGLTDVGPVDLITDLKFNQINNQFVEPFLAQYGGIDGISSLDGKTIVFQEQQADPEAGGWEVTTQFDPLIQSPSNNGLPGSYDTTLFDQTTPVLETNRYGIWQIRYVLTDDGQPYIRLNLIKTVSNLEKFSILYGTVYSSTQWYKNANGVFEEIPLLTAVLNTLYYQDGTDPEIFGRIKLIDQDAVNTLDIDEIIGQKNYTSPNGVVFTNGLKVQFTGSVIPESYQNQTYYVEGVGTAIKLLPVGNFVTPETYTQSATVPYDSTPYDVGNYDASLNQPLVPDYLTINRASDDLNAWTRSNRWFHVDVINATAEYNNTIAVLDNRFRARRPIIEFHAGTRLFDFGTQGKQPIDIIDFATTDALSTINGTTGYSVNGYTFINGTRVIFAADTDPQVRNKIYTVQFISPDSVAPLIDEPIINLVPASDANVLINQTVVCLSGTTQQGKSFYYDGVTWIAAQQKTSVNQAPLFDVYDPAGISFGNREYYPSTNFVGSKLFSYATGNGNIDPVLGFALKYLSLANVGDIVFDNNLYTDSFTYTRDSISTTENISLGFVRQYRDRVNFNKEIGWQSAVVKSQQRQQFKFTYDGRPLLLDVAVDQSLPVPGVQIFVGSEFQNPESYTVEVASASTTITLNSAFAIGDIVEVSVISDQASKVAFYQIPVNLENNPLNVNSATFTLGTVRSHYETIGQNLIALQGPINGANNTRDLGNIGIYGTNILQQSSPMTLAGYFMRSQEFNVFEAIEYNSREYEKFKAQMLNTAIQNDYTNFSVPEILTSVITYINAGRTSISPFYWSDMLPASSVYTQTVTTYTDISTPVFDLSTTYDFSSSNYQGLLVYVNDELLTIDYDYEVASDGPRLTILSPLVTGDIIKIQEYATTYGNFVPNTPTKLGLYPSFRPQIYLDTTYVNPTLVILGHDGSKTVAFGDFRDQLLLEFETRIFNNLKIRSDIPLPLTDVIPGQFRTTDYTLAEINSILSRDFLTWVGWNKLDYQTQDYIANNEFTWNYSSSGNLLSNINNAIDQSALPVGAWRGLYQYFYDTVDPSMTPWEMLGFSQEPAWWQDIYGAAPYTNGNLVLWEDLAAGRVADPAGEYFLPEYARPGLINVIPTGDEGQLLSPFNTVVGAYNSTQFQKSWTFGDGGPVEYTWRSSSSYPFAAMRLLALTRPAEFFSLFADRDLYKFNTDIGQYLYNNRYRLDANGIEIYGNGVSKASYIDWIVDYNQQLGINSTDRLTADLSHLDVRLCYRMGSFTDKQYLKIYAEKSSPNSLNSSLLLPDESYNLLFYKNQPFESVTYSSVIIQRVETGWAVFGYGITTPYFNILASNTGGSRTTISAGGATVTVPTSYTKNIVQVPYGYVFTNQTVVVDFLLSYGELLASQGLVFDSRENGKDLDWNQMAQEFLYWSEQGWSVGSVINLNPTATTLTAVKPGAIVDNIVVETAQNLILDQNRTTIPVRDLVINRQGNVFSVTSLSQQTINYLDLQYTNFESMVVLDNISIFNDLLYDPATGARQSRVNVSASVSADWNGQLDAQGFIFNNPETIKPWEPNKKYTKGEIVTYKNNYWSAQTIVQPSVEFNYNNWVNSDYTEIQQGLLENIALKANQLANSYNTNNANLDQDQDLLSYGLIGFRPRQYMTALNLDDVSQVNVYQQFLKDKGTIRSVRLLGNANLAKEVAEYDVFENWAIQRAVYGANANRSFIELRLNEALLDSNPSTVQVVQPQQISEANQTILLEDVWRESYKLTSTDIFPTTLVNGDTDTALPSAGYVNIDDVDVTVFSLQGRLALAPGVLDTIGVGTTIWAAKSNSYDWNIYRCNSVPGSISSISSNLDSTSSVRFTKPHGLSLDDIIIIRFVNSAVDGVYRVLKVVNPLIVVIELQISTPLTNNGICYRLQTMRVAQASDVVTLPYSTQLTAGSRAWVDNNGNDRWTVLEKIAPFSTDITLPVDIPVLNSNFGASVAQGYNNIIALVGAPSYSTTGAVYPYIRNDENQYSQSSLLTLGTTGTAGYGNAIDIGYQRWCLVGASESNNQQGYAVVIDRRTDSNVFEQAQLLVAADQEFVASEFGYSVTVSEDERWMYVGAPGRNRVYPYARVDVENQSVKYTTDGLTNVYSFNGIIDIDNTQTGQLNVVLNNQVYSYGTDYIIAGNSVALASIPPQGQTLIISRRQSKQLDRETFFNVPQNSGSTAGTGARFTVDNTRGTYTTSVTTPGQNYVAVTTQYEDTGSSGTTFIVANTTGITAGMRVVGSNFSGGQTVASVDSPTQLTLSAPPTTTPTDGATITFGDVLVINGSVLEVADSEPTSASGSNDLTIIVTSVDSNGGILTFNTQGSGVSNNSIFLISPYLYTVTNKYSFSVTVNGVLQRLHTDYDFNTDSTDAYSVIFEPSSLPPAGATIIVTSTTHWEPVLDFNDEPVIITIPAIPSGARFGTSVSTSTDGRQVVIGAINDQGGPNHPRSGSVYTIDRSVTRYIITDPSDLTYALPSGYQNPVAVLLNNEFLINTAQNSNGDFTVTGGNVVLSSNVNLNVGDVLELESNQFNQIQKIVANNLFDEADFGTAVDMCPTNCSIYIGAPLDGTVLAQAGSVQRNVNQSRVYGVITSTNANPSLTAGNTIRINNTPVAVPASPNNTVAGLASAINSAGIPNVQAVSSDGLITISVIDIEAADEGNRLTVLPGTAGTAYSDLGFDLYAYTQTIVSPNPSVNAYFGKSVFIDSEADNLVVGAPGGNIYEPVTFDQNKTYFDDRSTIFSSTELQSGAVYTFDYLNSANESVANPGQFVFGQQVYDADVTTLDQWGAAVNYTTGVLLIGSPGDNLDDSSLRYGRVAQFVNETRSPAWIPVHTQQPVVDVALLNSVYMYDKLQSSETQFFDFINPLQGKILGAARQNIDYITAVDPAKYNVGPVNNNGNYWAENHVGEMWWDTSLARFIDPNQDDITYASRRWGQLFPGSTVAVYQWIESSVPPSQYTGPGTPFDFNSFVVNSRLTQQGIFATLYYYWVTGIDTINTGAGKTLSTTGVARYIESPLSSGIPYIAALNSSTIAIYNGLNYISASDTIIHVDYDREFTNDNIHVEYELITQDQPDSFLSDGLYRKLQDSFCGVNTVGAKVPDPFLSPAEQYGIQFRPRQSMFADRYLALENYLVRANNVLKNYPIVETRTFTLLNSSEPEPTAASGEWNQRLANIEELSYQNLNEVPLGYRYLIVSDSTNDGLWSIYSVIQGLAQLGSPRETQLYRVQTYDTRKYWYHIDWYQPGYNSSIVPVAEVDNYANLVTLTTTTAPVGSSVKVVANAQGKFEIYLRTDIGWDRVGLQDGTIQFSESLWNYAFGRFGFDVEVFDAQYFDQEPVIETRKIIQAINEELFVGDLLIERNRGLISMFNYILSEFQSPEWLTKTSLIDVNHNIRELIPFQVFRQDNQDFVLDYIQEVKPYHVQIREFNLSYNGQDVYPGTVTDFDNPAYYDLDLEIPQFVSPVLLPYTKSSAVGTGTPNSISDTPGDAQIWQENPWSFWYNNYLLSLQEVEIIDGGAGYTEPPIVTVTGNAIVPAELEAVINSAGRVVAINVINPGAGYSTTAVIEITEGNGVGARAYAVMGNDLVRDIKTTIKYDRYQYQTTIVDWEPNVNYDNGTQVRYIGRVWQADSDDSSGVQSATFDPEQWLEVDADSLSGVDRTMGFYSPTPNQPGLDLPLLIDGVDYPGVQVDAPDFNQNTGYDVGNFDINPFDNIAFGPEGRPTYDPAILDAIYESSYLDIYLGTRPTDVNVDGGAYIDTYSSHAPEELVPGSEFDTLDFRVYTRPGSDWADNGHGFDLYSLNFTVTSVPFTYDFSVWYNEIPALVTGTLANQTTGVDLIPQLNYTVDWGNRTFTITSGINNGDVLTGTAYGLGGGNQLLQGGYNGADVGNSLNVNVQFDQIQELAIFVNGVYLPVDLNDSTENYSYAPSANNTTTITFLNTYTATDYVAVYVFGPTTINGTTIDYSWSAPVTQYINVTNTSLTFDLDNSLEYTNPVNMIVTINGVRARTAAGAEYYADDSSAFLLPSRLGFSQALIADNEVFVYLDDIPLVLGVDYTVEPFDVEGQREVLLTSLPAPGTRVLVAVTSQTQCYINNGQLVFDPLYGFIPSAGEVITVTTWNDTRQQDILTQVFTGPVTEGVVISQPYDSTDFDSPVLGNPTETQPGLFDYSDANLVSVNNFQLGRVITDPSRLWVTLALTPGNGGNRLFYGKDFTIVGEELVLTSGVISSISTLMVTQFTQSVVPNAMEFRVFQDMRGVQATYRMTADTTTTLAQPLSDSADIIYVDNASALSEPNVASNIWGVITIDGERIMYRERDTVNNTISSLRRGTAGTAADNHATGAIVYDLGRGNIMPEEFQNYIVSNTFLANGSTTAFVATNIEFDASQSAIVDSAVEVYVGGTRVTAGYTVSGIAPVTVTFNLAPNNGVEVLILVRRGVTWYAPGINTPSNGVALQDTDTQAARFLRGQ